MKIIFLDFDGVLNSIQQTVVLKRESYDASGINRISLGLVRWVCEMTDAKIVISSTWRSQGLDWIVGVVEANGWRNPPIIGCTPRLNGFRGDEVKEYLQHSGTHNTLESYVAIDDDSDFHPDQPLIKVDPVVGFTLYNAIDTIDILGVMEENIATVNGLRSHIEFQRNKKLKV